MLHHRSLLLLLAATLPLPSAGAVPGGGREAEGTARPDRAPSRPAVLAVAPPMHIEENLGQVPPEVAFLSRGAGYEAHLSPREARFLLAGPEGKGCAVTLRFPGARPEARTAGEAPLRGRSHYLLGADPGRWVRGARHFGRVAVDDLHPGIRLTWNPSPRGLRYDFEVAPGADTGVLVLAFDGAESVALDPAGDLVLRTPAGTLRHSRPLAWQETDEGRRFVDAAFVRREGGYGFRVGARDRTLPLVIDPTVEYATLLGGGNATRSRACAVDGSGDIYLGGDTTVSSFPKKNSYQSTFSGDALFVTKLSGEDHSILYSTLVGSPQQEILYGLAINADGEAHAVATCPDSFGDWPTVNPAQETNGGGIDGVVLRLSSDGSDLLYSTFLGGSGADYPRSIALEPGGAVVVAGITYSSNFPLQDEFRSTLGSGTDGFLTRISDDGGSFTFSTYLGGSADDACTGVSVDGEGKAWVCGYTWSDGMATSGAFQSSRDGGAEGFLAAVNPIEGTLDFLSYLGGSDDDYPYDVDAGGNGTVCVVGETLSDDFPTLVPLQSALGGYRDGFLVRITGGTRTLLHATYLGGSGEDSATSVALDPEDAALVTGTTASTNFPTASPSQASLGGGEDMFLAKVAADGSSLPFSTYWGGASDDLSYCVSTDGGLVLISGTTRGLDFPEVDGRNESNLGQIAVGAMAVRLLPGPFRDLRITAADGTGVHLEWTDPHAGAYDVEVERRSPGEAYAKIATLTEGETEFVDDPMEEGSFFEYRVRGVSASGNTACTFPVRASFPFQAPAGPSATGDDTPRVSLAWTDSSTKEEGYLVRRRELPSGSYATVAELAADAESWEDLTVGAETAYGYRIRGVYPGGTELETEEVTAATPFLPPGDASAESPANRRIVLSWTDRSKKELGYRILRWVLPAGAEEELADLAPGTAEYEDGSAEPETSYGYRIRGLFPGGETGDSDALEVTTGPADPLDAGAITLDDESLRFTWTDASAAEQSWEVEGKPAASEGAFGVLAVLPADSEEFHHGTLQPETEYLYRVRARNGHGASEYAGPISGWTAPAMPGSPDGAALSPVAARITWVDASQAEARYVVERSEGEGGGYEALAVLPPGTTEYEDVGLLQEETYSYRVRTENGYGASRWALPPAVRTPSQMLLAAAKLSPASGKRAARLDLTASFDTGEGGPDLSGPAEIRLGDASLAVPSFTVLKGGRLLRHAAPGVQVDLKPSRTGGSGVQVRLKVEGGLADGLEPEGALSVAFTWGDYSARGAAVMEGGVFDGARGVGRLLHPSIHLVGLKARVGAPGKDSLSMDLVVERLDAPPVLPPRLSLSLGEGFSVEFPGALFEEKKGVLRIQLKGEESWKVQWSPLKGTLSIDGKGLDLGTHPEGPSAVPVSVTLGEDRYRDVPILVRNGSSLLP